MKTTNEPAAIWMDTATLRPWRGNPRDNEAAVPGVAESIKRFGFAAPIIARPHGDGFEVIAGHTRLKAAQRLGLDRVPVRVMDLDPGDAKLLALADNKVGEIATWSEDLGDLMRELEADGLDLGGLGWSDLELSTLMAPPVFDPLPGDDEAPDLEDEAESKRGQVYQCGPHVVICGDSTDPDLWADHPIDILLTDPPYCSGGKQESARSIGSVGRDNGETWRDVERDNLTTDGLIALLDRVIRNVAATRVAYVFCDWRQLQNVRRTVEPLGYAYRSLIVWDKQGGGMGWPFMHSYELVYCGIRNWSQTNDGGGCLMDIQRYPRTKNEQHTTQKPVELLQPLIDATPGEVIGDPFGGSGSTLIAAAMANRRAVVCEFDPRYVDVIRRRWTAWAKARGLEPGPGGLE